ncbi:MAG TPA: hypothetical protein PKD70_14165 [Saprospiraceae bacterium]|nr:hypothetical protein [Saprospiraceae bacterium]HMP15019.1 hypothetical protein [Saprospiraceae bacterium]
MKRMLLLRYKVLKKVGQMLHAKPVALIALSLQLIAIVVQVLGLNIVKEAAVLTPLLQDGFSIFVTRLVKIISEFLE